LNAGWHRQTNYAGRPPVENLPINKNCSSLLYHFHPSNHPLCHHEQEGQTRVVGHAGHSAAACCRNLPRPVDSACSPLLIFLHSDAKATYIYTYIFSPQITAKWSD
jgi:hypothetical protein